MRTSKRKKKKNQWDLRPSLLGQALESSTLQSTQWRWEEVTRSIKSDRGEVEGNPSQTLRTSVPLDSGPRAALWHGLYLALSGYLQQCCYFAFHMLMSFLNWIRNGLWSGECLYSRLRALSGHAWHLTVRFLGLHNCTLNFLNEILGEMSEKKGVCAPSACERLPKRHNRGQSTGISNTLQNLGAEHVNDLIWLF